MSTHLDEKYIELRRLVAEMAGRRLPGERELATRLGISRPGLRSLLTTLEAEGLVRRQQGSGTYAVDLQHSGLNTVVLLIDKELKLGDDPFFSQLLERLQAHLQAAGISCVIERIGERQRPNHMQDGAITLGMAGRSVLEALRPDDPPVVGLLVKAGVPAKAHASVFQLADKEAGADAAQRLISLQCRELVFVGRRDLPASYERLMGAEETAIQAGCHCSFVNCALNYTAGLRLGRTMKLPTGPEPIGLIVTNDWLAVGLQAGLTSRSSDALPPIHIVSFDGLSITEDPLLGIESLMIPLDTIVTDAIAELRRLRQPGAPVGRSVRYAFYWR
jgi:DNA-binding LacI/PurR family transcriptional regulator